MEFNINKFIEQITNAVKSAHKVKNEKHSAINLTLVTKTLAKKENKVNKLYCTEIKNAHSKYNGSVYVFDKTKTEADNKDGVIYINKISPKELKRNMQWFIYPNKDKTQNVVIKKMLMPLNISDFPLDKCMHKIFSGNLVKVFVANNYISCKIGDVNNNTVEQIIENIQNIISLVSSLGKIIIKIHVHRNMSKSNKIVTTK